MSLFSLKNISRNCFLLLLTITLIVIWGGDVKGQRVYAQYVGPYPANTGGTNGAAGTAGSLGGVAGAVGSHVTNNPTNINDADLTNTADIVAVSGTSGTGLLPGPGGGSTSYMNLNFVGAVTPIAQTAIIIKLTADALNKVQVQAYTSGGTSIGSLVAISTLPTTGSGDYIFTTTAACSSIRIISNTDATGLLATTTNTAKVFYAYFMDPTCSLTSYTTTSMTGVNLGSGFTTPDNAIDGNMTTYSRLATGLGVATTLNQDIYLSKLTGAQDAATITFSIPPALLAAGVAGYINIITYNGTTNVGQVAFSGLLLGTDLLTLVKSGLPTTLSYAPGVPFNRIQISTSSLVGLATSLDIYEVSTTPAKPTFTLPTTQNLTICAGNSATLNAVPASTGNELRWYSAMMGGTLLHTGNSYTPSPTPTADTTTYFVATGKIGCTIESERVPAKIIVLPLPVVSAITGTLSACIGSTTQLGNPTAGGTWSNLNTAIATISNTGLVTGVASGTATINYVVTGANGCPTTVSAIVTINALPVVSPITGTLSACIGKTTQLSSTTSGGVWTSATPAVATVNSSGLVTGVTAGTSLITYTVTNGNGCVAIQTATVTINTLPAVPTISGTLTACVGKTTTLTGSPTGGAWSSATPTVATIDPTTGIVTGVTAGTSVITYTVTNANGCTASQTVTVTINALPVVNPITGTLNACIGNTTQLSSTTSGGVWTSATPAVATVNSSGLVTGVTAGTSLITYTVTNGNGCVAIQNATVTINALPAVPTISGTLTACVGKTTTLTGSPTGGAWSSATPAVATIDPATGIVTGVTAGTSVITYTVTNANGCTTSQTATVTINALPVVNPITGTLNACIGNTTQLSSTTSGGVWTSATPAVATVNSSGLVTGVTAGTSLITYTVTNGNGCVAIQTATVTINALPVVAAITGTLTACIGNTTQLSSTTSGGVWTSGTPAVASINSSGLVTGVTAGTSLITYTVTNGNGCVTTQTATVTINALPVVAPITGTMSTCIGKTTQLANTTSSGVWSSANPTIATVNSTGLVTGVAVGTATINYTVTNGNGCITVVTTSVVVHLQPALPAITQKNLCLGQSIDLNTLNPNDGNGTTGGTYSWSAVSAGGTPLSSTLVSPALGNTTYYLRYTKDGCFSDSSVLIIMHPKPLTPHVTLN